MDIILSAATEHLLRDALEEDIGVGDITTMSTVPADLEGRGLVRAKKDCVMAGLVIIPKLFNLVDPQAKANLLAHDGDEVKAGTVVCETEDPCALSSWWREHC